MVNKKGKFNWWIVAIIIILVIALLALACFFIFIKMNKTTSNSSVINNLNNNPVLHIIAENTKNGIVNQSAVVQQAVLEFNASYINYLISALGTSALHSAIGFGNPKIEIVLGDEVWSSELGDKMITQKGKSDNPDIRIRMSKDEAVKALMSADIKQYMKQSVASGRTGIEMIAGKIELYSKGYLDMYNALKGN